MRKINVQKMVTGPLVDSYKKPLSNVCTVVLEKRILSQNENDGRELKKLTFSTIFGWVRTIIFQ
jgi:hypothetical protein